MTDYRKDVFWTNNKSILHDSTGTPVPRVKLDPESATEYYGFLVTLRSISSSFDEAQNFWKVKIMIVFDWDSTGPIPRLTLFGSLLVSALLVGFLIYNLQHNLLEYKFILFAPFITNDNEEEEKKDADGKLKVN